MNLPRNNSRSALPGSSQGNTNNFICVHIETPTNPTIESNVAHPGGNLYAENSTHDQSLGLFSSISRDTVAYAATTTSTVQTGRGTHQTIPTAIGSSSHRGLQEEIPRPFAGLLQIESAGLGLPAPSTSQHISNQDESSEDEDDNEDIDEDIAEDDIDDDSLEMASRKKPVDGDADLVIHNLDLEYISERGTYFFTPGRLLLVRSEDDSYISGRTMIVLSVSHHGFIQCLALCRHQGHTGEENHGFYRAHAAVYHEAEPESMSALGAGNKAIEIELIKGAQVKDCCYVNFEHTWTLQQEKVQVAHLGYVRPSQRKEVLVNYSSAQKSLLERTTKEYFPK